ncbi:MAG TPA: O-antigen ligase family protein, partial [Anaeromyxobacteraceae bacterium]|nr:O-antigen ligase family protein [Anaeromyxobacteraceae bacterium]
LALLSPTGEGVQRAALEPLGLYPAARPLTLDPGATAQELAKLATWACAAAAAALLGDSRERRERILKAVALSGVGVGLACYGGALLGLGRLTESKATFVNPNHLSSFLLLTCWIALGFGLRARGPERVAWIAGFVVAGSQVFLSLSRAGIAAFFVGAGMAAVLAIHSGHAAAAVRRLSGAAASGAAGAWRAVAAPAAISAALAVTAWLALDRVVAELRTVSTVGSDVKLSLWPLGAQVLSQYPLLGIGRGAFDTLFAAYKVEMAQVTFTHLENTWLQVPIDVGVPAGLAFLVLLGLSWVWGARARELSRPMIGALAGVTAVAAHDVFDFSLELNGVAIPFLVILALSGREGPVVRPPRWALRVGAAAALLLAALGLSLHLTHDLDRQSREVFDAKTADEASAAARDALAWHPADWVPPATVGAKLVEEGRCREGMEWLNRAMVRNPTAPEPHRSAARCLAAVGQDAAAKREFRLAFVYGDRGALEEARDTFTEPLALLDVAPDTPVGLLTAGALLASKPDEAHEAYSRAWESFHDPAALSGLAQVTLTLDDPETALELARELEQLRPTEPAGYTIASAALAKLERDDEATKELEEATARLPKVPQLFAALGIRHLQARRFSQAKLTFEKMVVHEGPELAQKHLLIAAALESQGRLGEALREAQEAHEALPGMPGPLVTVSRIAAASRLYQVAIDALERASHLPGVPPGGYDEQLATLRAAKDEQEVKWMEKQVGGRR